MPVLQRAVHRVKVLATALLDTIIPPKARTLRMRNAAELVPDPKTEHIQKHDIVSLIPYHTPGVEDAIRALKYDGNATAAQLLARMLEDYLHEEIANLRAFSARDIILVPVPLHAKRRRERGFNQIERVFAQLPQGFRDGTYARVEPRALFRTRHTPQQTRLSRAERLTNVKGAFAANEQLVRGTHVLLVDDVCTTGSTLLECTRTLEKAGARVSAIALARA